MTEAVEAPLTVWVDADACPNVIKDILYRAAERKQVPTVLVANQFLRVPQSAYIRSVQVAAGFDVADNYIAAHCLGDDLVITADIPLAAEVVEKGVLAINPRGELYTAENIRQRLNMRDFMAELRDAGMVSGGPPKLGQTDRQQFANQLDRLLTRLLRKR
ncbi:YaiI/YqxD family protein [Aliamphritea ceti]|uniref:YaiI/YqxD family protein n=1 Tax=Aliamphritea ceti TaxID=1524258 RepID=UPI0021C30E57|nr:YaiI/YqxD family protein [Aliamphritea ceti]